MSSISAGTSISTALVSTGDTSGNLELKINGGTTAVTLNTSGAVGVGSSPSYGTSGQVLTSAGSAAAPTWAAPATGAMTLISTQTASNSASLQWTGLSGYSKYVLIYSDMIPVSNFDSLFGVVGTGAGPTYITSAGAYRQQYILGTGSTVSTSPASTTLFYLDTQGAYNLGTGISGQALFFNFNNSVTGDTSFFVNSFTQMDSVPNHGTLVNNGRVANNSTAKTAIKIYYASGNISTGTASLYGISS